MTDLTMSILDGPLEQTDLGLEDENFDLGQNNLLGYLGRTIRTDVLTATELDSIRTSFWTSFADDSDVVLDVVLDVVRGRFGRRFGR